MVESSNPTKIPSSPKITLKEEPATQDRPESPNPLLPAHQVEFKFDDITFNTNNEVALLYPSHPKSEYFQVVLDFISKCCLKEAFTRAPNQYKEYLSEFWYTAKTLEDSKIWVSTPTGGIRGEIGITTFRNALRAHYLSHSSKYAKTPSLATVRPWFSSIGYSGEIGAKGTLKKSFLPPRWRLLMAQIIQCLGGKTGGHDQISNKDAIILYCLANGVEIDFARLIWEDIIHKLNKKSREKVVPYPRFISLLLEYMMPEYENDELTLNPTQVFSVHNWALDPNQHERPPFTDHMKAICNIDVPVESKAPTTSSKTVMKDLQAAGDPTSVGVAREEGAHPQLSSGMDERTKNYAPGHTFAATNPSVLVDQTKSARDGLKNGRTNLGTNEESRSNDNLKKIKLEDLSDLIKDTRSAFFTPDSPNDEPIIVTDKSEEEAAENTKKLLVTSLKPELSNLLASHDFASSIPNELKELPSKITTLSGEIQELNRNVQGMEIERPIAELKMLKWELPAEFLALPN
ncbi:hypothetical protein Tco_0673436 [Tanacetum coccineum]